MNSKIADKKILRANNQNGIYEEVINIKGQRFNMNKTYNFNIS